ncbi:MAG TPA: hypothetical protein PKD59_04385 [Miltoncostaeaceae bacterium]|nr:hypothetical protein [Miltoncostaeaceae bacterium]
MSRSARRALCLALVAAVPVGAAAAGCSDSGGTASAPPSVTAADASLPLTARVVRGRELTGFVAGPARPLGLAAVAKENDVTVAELRRRGVERAAKSELAGPPRSFGISAVARLGTPEQARAEVARLFAANGSSEPGLTAVPIAVPGIPGAMGARKTGRHEGQDYVAIEVAWPDGVLAHELFVLARARDLDQAAVLAAATAVATRAEGAPLPSA